MRLRNIFTSSIAVCLCMLAPAQNRVEDMHPNFKVITDTSREPIAPGTWEPTVESLSAWECPDWIHECKAENWDPDALVKLYKDAFRPLPLERVRD